MSAALNLLLVGSAIALAVALAFAVARQAAPRVRYAIAVIAFLAAAIVPFMPRSARVPRAVPTASGRPEAVATPVVTPELRIPAPATDYVPLIWLAIAAALLARELLGHAVLHFRRREWEPASRELCESLGWPDDVPLFVSDADGPSTIGLLRPVVVLPAWLNAGAAARVARHELAHARWRDPLVNAVVRIVRAILWPSLPLWYLERVIRTEREVAADRYAVYGNASAASVAEYASALVDAAGRRARRHRAATALGNGIGLEERVARLFNAGRASAWRVVCAAALLLAGGAATIAVPVASQQTPPPHAIPANATVEYELAARALNDILGRTRFHNHEATPTVHELLARIRATRTVAPLLDALSARDRRTRESVAWVAGELGDAALVPALVARLEDPDPHVQQSSAWALGMIGDRSAIPPLIASLRAREPSARHGAAWALGRLRATDAVEPLLPLLADASTDVQHGAAWALGMIADERAIPGLELLHDRTWNREIREETKRALIRLGRPPHS